MITTRGAARRAVLSFTQQVSLSVLGTLAATAVVTMVKSEWAIRPAAWPPGPEQTTVSALPSLTPGGKFATRALSGHDPEPFVIVMHPPQGLPLFTAMAMPPLGLTEASVAPFQASVTEAVIGDRGPQPTSLAAQPTLRHARPHSAAAPLLPPHRSDGGVLAMAPRPVLLDVPSDDKSFWSRSGTAYRQVAAWGGTLIATLLP